jgi:hypothetical protein
VHYSTSGGWNMPADQRGLFVHMMPRSDGIVLGGTSERGVGTTDVNEQEKARIISNHITLFAAMKPPMGHPPLAPPTARR